MTNKQILTTCKTWINQVINFDKNASIEIISSNQNNPLPKMPFLIMYYPRLSEMAGLGNSFGIDDEENESITIAYEATITIEEVGGTGDLLRLLLNSINRHDVIDLFRNNNMSIMRVNRSDTGNYEHEEKYINRSTCDLVIMHIEKFKNKMHYYDKIKANQELIHE